MMVAPCSRNLNDHFRLLLFRLPCRNTDIYIYTEFSFLWRVGGYLIKVGGPGRDLFYHLLKTYDW